uniref:Uncharacterized protein n=1 Tax=Arundo donax TaxID=35708 RepID=A0A0A8YI20_ARUDO
MIHFSYQCNQAKRKKQTKLTRSYNRERKRKTKSNKLNQKTVTTIRGN